MWYNIWGFKKKFLGKTNSCSHSYVCSICEQDYRMWNMEVCSTAVNWEYCICILMVYFTAVLNKLGMPKVIQENQVLCFEICMNRDPLSSFQGSTPFVLTGVAQRGIGSFHQSIRVLYSAVASSSHFISVPVRVDSMSWSSCQKHLVPHVGSL